MNLVKSTQARRQREYESDMRIFASTSCLPDHSLDLVVPFLFESGFDGVELSASAPDPGIVNKIAQWRSLGMLSIHNYFPRPQDDFVFNLASADDGVLSRSLRHARSVLELAHDHSMGWVSFHSGFLFDPLPEELGQSVTPRPLNNREEALETFIDRARIVSEYGARKGVRVLWENNVLSAANHEAFSTNPFLLVEPHEMLTFSSQMPDNSGLLLDVAHLSVSCQSLGIDRVSALQSLESAVTGVHLSEDSGVIDDGMLLSPGSWFWEHLPESPEYCVVESHFVDGHGIAVQQNQVARIGLRKARDRRMVQKPGAETGSGRSSS